MGESEKSDIKEQVREWYGSWARSASSSCCGTGAEAGSGPNTSCCDSKTGAEMSGPSCCGGYEPADLAALPSNMVTASLGCGNPTALAGIGPGEVVLDLGSGAGLDVLLSARRTGPTGKVYGLDMTDEMLSLARENQRRVGIDNVEFLKGDIEDIPLPDESVDVIISNCVINLAADKDLVLSEAYRVLRPGGRLAVSDVVFEGDTALLPSEIMSSREAWSACVAGALEKDDYAARLSAAGFTDASIEITNTLEAGLPPGVRLASSFIRARKPR